MNYVMHVQCACRIVKLKSEKRQKSHEKKQKVVENKKSLGAVRYAHAINSVIHLHVPNLHGG